jgi:hypothetical protein
MKKVFEVITDNYKYGIQCNDNVEAMKWVFDNTSERFINSTTEIDESRWDDPNIQTEVVGNSEDFKVSISDLFDKRAKEPYLIYTNDQSFND